MEKSRTLAIANVSSSTTDMGRWTLWDIKAITISWLFRITTPIPALSSSVNTTPSKFILYISPGVVHLVLGLAIIDHFFGCAAQNSIKEVNAHCDTWSKGKPGGENLTLLHLNQMVHVSIEKNSAMQSNSKTKDRNCRKSEKLIFLLKLHWGSLSQIENNLGQFQSACNTCNKHVFKII